MRRDDDQWDITTSVGATALAVAAGRAVETERADGLVRDPYAQAFVDATGTEMPDRPWNDEAWAAQATYLGVRSRFFDDCLCGAARAGVDQVVILAAGLDTRAFRLDWPSGVTVYEIDQSAVLEFKDTVLDREGADAAAGRSVVPVDLRHDWPAALTAAGFDPSWRTVWLAEGLLPYLPAAAERLLFERVQELSAPGSRIAVEHFGGSIEKITSSPEFRTMSQQVIGADVRTLFFEEERGSSPEAWLSGHGWAVTSRLSGDLAREYGRPLPASVQDVMGGVELLRADLTG
ncbi:class I SAM-dependent methyltransferase [Pseudonocardia sp. KRD291]|uniref:class I SAM-dependent methyltransferase n=1 Tax=Pseudonocardia sp. KRD291 TaxID=2792007 RepID=UPI001C4A4254|nr:class I SAM-dependent methyltransferase [Pseudonocardia sp. KRD291]MBW0104621.1 class I SAM-dependent methyltransferase [Pseudonocardia sp. KRD291]